MKKAYSFPIRFTETSMILNALMAINERKFVKTDVILYDIRELEKYEESHFCNSQHYDINGWSDSFNIEFVKVTQFKNVFLIGDESLFSSSHFEKFMLSLAKTKLKVVGMYLYVMDSTVIESEKLDGLLVTNKQPTKLWYYPSLIVENEMLGCGGIFLAKDFVHSDQLEKLGISNALFIGSPEQGKEIKKSIKWVQSIFSSQETVENTENVWESAWKILKKALGSKKSVWIISSDPDNLGALLAIYYLMNVKGYSYHDASKYVIYMRFSINMTQGFQNFLKYLFVSLDKRPKSPQPLPEKEINSTNNKTPEPEFKIEETFQMKLRNKNFKKEVPKKINSKTKNPQEDIIQKALESLYSQVKKKVPQLEKTTKMLDEISRWIIENLEVTMYRYIKTSNKGFKANILKYKAAVEILQFLGFVLTQNEAGEEWYSFPMTTSITTLKGRRLQIKKCTEDFKMYKLFK